MILGKLKEATKEQHKNLEGIVNIMENGFSRIGYERLIAKFYCFYKGIEPVIESCGLESTGFDFAPRRKTPLLERDLIKLGIYDTVTEYPTKWTDLPVIDTPAKGFGSLYVLEGATLGGQIIVRHLKQHLDITPESGCAFFNSYGDRVGPMWKEFGAAITAFAEKNGDDETIVKAAKETFDSFARCFSNNAAALEIGV